MGGLDGAEPRVVKDPEDGRTAVGRSTIAMPSLRGDPLAAIGVVVIARNEGERFRRCLASLESAGAPIVYVDSGSTDGSVDWAWPRCSAVVTLDSTIAFTAARARNAGFEKLVAAHPAVELVQFVDGDCEVAPGWLDRATREVLADPRRAVVCGRRRERFPSRSIYNKFCDIEWDTPVGAATACGGDFMVRVAAFREVGGFDAKVLAGEEPELCLRLRLRGWTIHRVAAEMTIHDAAIDRFAQWWRRSVRGGYGYAQCFALHRGAREGLYAHKLRSIVASGLLVLALALAPAPATQGWSLALLIWYPARIARFALACRKRGLGWRDAWAYSAFCMLGNVPNLVGVMKYVASLAGSRPARLGEYKDAPRAPARR
jgi:cellulose synthase/poly-beta-1,6-N-acetylglucosamine synthase-like glycosyltransferase